jgi:hypothetical protein
MTISLTHAASALLEQSPKEYLGQLAVAAHALRQAKGAGGKGTPVAPGGPKSPLEEFRGMMEPGGRD